MAISFQLLMQATQKSNKQYLGGFLQEMAHSSVGSHTRRKSVALVDHYTSRGGSVANENILMGNLFNAAQDSMALEFQRKFMFGCRMTIWRKAKKKQCTFFIDQHVPSFMWISTNSKAFLFDLSFCSIQRFDYEIENETQLKHYFILRYFEEELPIIFEGLNAAKECHSFYDLFHNYIVYNRIMGEYPSFFSQILKKSIIEDIRDDIVRSSKALDVLKVSDDISWNFKQFNQDVMKFILNAKGAGSNLQTTLSHQEINNYFKISSCCDQIRQVFSKYAGFKFINFLDYLKPIMKKQTFLAFLQQEQHQSLEYIEEIAQSGKDMYSFYDFSLYILNEKDNSAASAGTIDENLPLGDYFCYSSHNTYLSGNQLTSDSKIDRYLQDLDNGLKCVELDVHNDGARPIITHAFKDKSLCKPIDFQQTLEVISRFCKQNQNHYPIILSVQNHASQSNRYKMLNIIVKTFGDKLLLVGNDLQLHQLSTFKTLRELKGKVIVKTDSKIGQVVSYKQNLAQINQNKVQNQHNFDFSSHMPKGEYPSTDFNNRFRQFQESTERYNQRKQQFSSTLQKSLYLPLQEMTKVSALFKSPQGIDNNNSCAYQCTSLTNEKAQKAKEDFIINYTKRSWLRIYPSATEINSGNYNPIPLFRIGAQIIALNTQTKDDNALIQMSYFTAGMDRSPSKIGYIPKPPHLLQGNNIPRDLRVKQIQIGLISNDSIKIRLHGSGQDMKRNPHSGLAFTVKDYLEGFLIFQIGEHYKDCVPLRFLKQGYRVLVARNQFFRDSGKRILIQVKVKEFYG